MAWNPNEIMRAYKLHNNIELIRSSTYKLRNIIDPIRNSTYKLCNFIELIRRSFVILN